MFWKHFSSTQVIRFGGSYELCTTAPPRPRLDSVRPSACVLGYKRGRRKNWLISHIFLLSFPSLQTKTGGEREKSMSQSAWGNAGGGKEERALQQGTQRTERTLQSTRRYRERHRAAIASVIPQLIRFCPPSVSIPKSSSCGTSCARARHGFPEREKRE